MSNLSRKLESTIRDVADFPKPGIVFKDLTPILADPKLSLELAEGLYHQAVSFKPEIVLALESRGFWFGVSLAARLNVPFIPVRKAGKLPADRFSESYSLEYGQATLEMHTDAIKPNSRVLVHDDLLATGGSAAAASRLVARAGAFTCGYLFIVELAFLNGRAALNTDAPVKSILTYS